MKPTGIPMINAGFTIPSFTILITSISAVGALPIATIPPSISDSADLIDIWDLVLFSFFAISIIFGSEILQIILFWKSFGFCLFKPPITPFTSTTMLHPFFKAVIPLWIASLWNITLLSPAKSKSAVEWIILLTMGHSFSL